MSYADLWHCDNDEQHTVLVEEDNAHVIAVDTRDITLHKVQLLSSGSPEDMKYELSTVKEALGSTLSITLPSGLKKVRLKPTRAVIHVSQLLLVPVATLAA